MQTENNLVILSIANTNQQSSYGQWKVEVTFRIDDNEPQKIVVPWREISCFGYFRRLIFKKFRKFVHHETEGTKGPWSKMLCRAIEAGWEKCS